MEHNEIDQMMQRVQADLQKADPGQRAIVGMLGIIAHLLGAMGEDQEKMASNIKQLAKQFDQVSACGNALLTESR